MVTKVGLGQEWNFLKKVNYTSGSRTAFSVIAWYDKQVCRRRGEECGETDISLI